MRPSRKPSGTDKTRNPSCMRCGSSDVRAEFGGYEEIPCRLACQPEHKFHEEPLLVCVCRACGFVWRDATTSTLAS